MSVIRTTKPCPMGMDTFASEKFWLAEGMFSARGVGYPGLWERKKSKAIRLYS